VVRTNFFAVRLPKGPIFDYTVEITPSPSMRREKDRIFQLLEQHPTISPHVPFIAHDKSRRIVSVRELEQPLEVQINYTDEEAPPTAVARPYQVRITFCNTLDPQQLTR